MEQIRELKYHTSHIQRLLISISEKMDNNAKVAKLLLTIPAFRIGEFIPSADIKDCLIIEDSLSGIQNAYNSGCNMIIVIDSANKKDEYEKLPGVIKVIDDFTQI